MNRLVCLLILAGLLGTTLGCNGSGPQTPDTSAPPPTGGLQRAHGRLRAAAAAHSWAVISSDQ